MNQCQPMIQQTIDNQQIIKAIVHWKHDRGDSHCLVRVYVQPERVTVLASEIRSNFRDDYKNEGISSGLAGVANALLECFPKIFSVEPERIVWIAHYGAFSDYENIGTDSFHPKLLHFNNGRFEDSAEEVRQTEKQMRTPPGNLKIENIYDVLREIGWTRHNR